MNTDIDAMMTAYGLHDWLQAQGGIDVDMSDASAGQLQRIQGLSALLQCRPILVLDEITSHCDLKTQAMIHDYLMALDVTILVATHQLDLMKKCNRVVFFKPDGQVVLSDHSSLSQSDVDYQLLLATTKQV